MLSRLSLIPPHRDAIDDALKLHDGVSTDTREITIVASPQRHSASTPETGNLDASGTSNSIGPSTGSTTSNGNGNGSPASGGGLNELLGGNPRRPAPRNDESTPTTGQLPETGAPERQPGRPKRSSVPSWDEIVFGTRGD
jgi:hypothetical protein